MAATETLTADVTVGSDHITRVLRISDRSLGRMCKRGEFPRPFRVGGLKRWKLSTLVAWIEARVEQAQQEVAHVG